MNSIILYRPVGLFELELIHQSNYTEFPPRLDWQPIFYPVLNEAYAIEIATKWNLDDAGSGYSGFVTQFNINKTFIKKYKVENVGGKIHDELWIPSEELQEFNNNIIGEIKITKAYFGEKFKYPESNRLKQLINQKRNETQSH